MTMNNVIRAIFGENDSTTNDTKIGEELSSELDIDEVDDKEYEKPKKLQEKPVKRITSIESTATSVSRRPVRNRAKPKRADFEYDLSNLLKMDAQGYRETQNSTPIIVKQSPPLNKAYPVQLKKKTQSDSQSNNSNESPRECAGALLTMSKKSDEISAAHIRPTDLSLYNIADQITCKYSMRTLFPRTNRLEKSSPRKQKLEYNRDSGVKVNRWIAKQTEIKKVIDTSASNRNKVQSLGVEEKNNSEDNRLHDVSEIKEEPENTTNISRASLEAMKNKSFAELSKGMKTKILVIKPINKNKDGNTVVNQTLKFQRIKLNPVDKSLLVKVPSISRVTPLEQNQSNGDIANESENTEQPNDKLSSNITEMLVEDYQIPNNPDLNDGTSADGLSDENATEPNINETLAEIDEMEIIQEVLQ